MIQRPRNILNRAMLVSSLFHCFYLTFKYLKAKEKNITSLTINETEEIRKQKKRANKCERGRRVEGEKRGKGGRRGGRGEESGEGRGKWGQKEFDEKTNKQTNKQTLVQKHKKTNGNEENQAKLLKTKFKTSHKLVMQHLFVICFLA